MEKRKVTMHGQPLTLSGEAVKTGEKAPAFQALNQEMKLVSLDDFRGKTIIISVFPSIDTSVCSAQMHRFNQIAADADENVVILTISCDLPFALHRYCAAEGIERVITISDYRDTDFGIKYGFLIQELRLLSRGIVIIDKDQKIRYTEYVTEITHEPDYQKALDTLHTLLEA